MPDWCGFFGASSVSILQKHPLPCHECLSFLSRCHRFANQALDKEAAALIEARNSVVAAWLWRRFAADTPLAANHIRIDPWCGALA